MARFIKDRTKIIGKAPGSLILIGKQKMEFPIIRLMQYDKNNIEEKELKSIEEVNSLKDEKNVTWVNIYGIHDTQLIDKVGDIFKLPSLFLENLLNTDQRPKYEDGEKFNAFILKMLKYDETERKIYAEQITLVIGNYYVLTLQEQVGDVFNAVRERIRNKKGRIRLNDNDYLAYVLLDTIVDNYILVIETIGRYIEELEEKIFHSYSSKTIEEIYKHKTELSYLRKSIRPVRDLMTQLLKSDNLIFLDKNLEFLKDLNGLVVHAADAIELYSNMISDHLSIYHTNVSNRMNEVMKVLTIFASIFIPLSFLAGVYGMNFEYIPELKFRYGYFMFLGAVVFIGGGLIYYFKRKKWL